MWYHKLSLQRARRLFAGWDSHRRLSTRVVPFKLFTTRVLHCFHENIIFYFLLSWGNVDYMHLKEFIYWLNFLCQQQCKVTVSVIAVAAMGFTVEDKHFINWLWVSENYETKYLFKMFPDRGQNFAELKTLIAENASSGSVVLRPCRGCGQPRSARCPRCFSLELGVEMKPLSRSRSCSWSQ